MVMDRAWGKPREYDPDKEAPKKAPPFDPKLYTTEELRRMQEVMNDDRRAAGTDATGGGRGGRACR